MPCAPALFAPACYHREVLSWLSFDAPWLLLGLLLLPALPLLLPRRGAWFVRLAALALLIVRPSRNLPPCGPVATWRCSLTCRTASVRGAWEALQEFDFTSLRRDPSLFYFAADATEMPGGGAAEVPAYLQTERTRPLPGPAGGRLGGCQTRAAPFRRRGVGGERAAGPAGRARRHLPRGPAAGRARARAPHPRRSEPRRNGRGDRRGREATWRPR